MDENMQLTIKSFRQIFPQDFFPDTSMTFSKIHHISLTAVKFPDISRFSRQVVTLDERILIVTPGGGSQQHQPLFLVVTVNTTTKTNFNICIPVEIVTVVSDKDMWLYFKNMIEKMSNG